MAEGKEHRARNILKTMNLTKQDKDPGKAPYASNSEIAKQLGFKDSTIISNVRRNLIFVRNIGISMDCLEHGVLYTWRWSGDNEHAKIGASTVKNLRERMISTYHPTDDALLIGFSLFTDRQEAQKRETSLLNSLRRVHSKREWVYINDEFNKLLNKEFKRIDKTKEDILK